LQNGSVRISAGQKMAGYVIAVLTGLLAPFSAALEISAFMPVVFITSILMAFLHGFAGRGPMIACAIAHGLMMGAGLGSDFMYMLLFAAVLPTIWVLRMVDRNVPFFTQMLHGIIAFAIGLLLAVFMAFALYGGEIASSIVESVRAAINTIPQEYMDMYAANLNSIDESILANSSVEEILSQALYFVEEQLNMQLPGMLLSGAALTSVFCVSMGNRMRAHKGLATVESFVPLHRWFLPSHLTLGLLGMLAASGVCILLGMSAGRGAFYTIWLLMIYAFYVQAAASFMRRLMLTRLRSRGRCGVLAAIFIVSLLLGMAEMLAMFGGLSALFGSRGAVTLWLLKRQAGKDKDDKPEI